MYGIHGHQSDTVELNAFGCSLSSIHALSLMTRVPNLSVIYSLQLRPRVMGTKKRIHTQGEFGNLFL